MKKEGRANPSPYNVRNGDNKNLCVSGEDAEHESKESWGIVIFEKGQVREMVA